MKKLAIIPTLMFIGYEVIRTEWTSRMVTVFGTGILSGIVASYLVVHFVFKRYGGEKD